MQLGDTKVCFVKERLRGDLVLGSIDGFWIRRSGFGSGQLSCGSGVGIKVGQDEQSFFSNCHKIGTFLGWNTFRYSDNADQC